MTEKTNPKLLSLIAYHVTDGEDGNWRRIGAAWDHEDAKGLTLQLEKVPVAVTGRIVLREPKPKEQAAA